jgi:predicted dienelactone hydrolase
VLQNRLNLQQVGVIGHSHGGYAALSLAGATINFELLRRDANAIISEYVAVGTMQDGWIATY